MSNRLLNRDFIFKVLFTISGTMLSISLSDEGMYIYRLCGEIIAFIFLLVVSFRISKSYFNNKKIIVISVIFSVFININIQNSFFKHNVLVENQFIKTLFYVLPIIFLVCFFYYFINKIEEYYHIIVDDLEKYEKMCIIIFCSLFFAVGLIIYLKTTIFTTCVSSEGWTFFFDVLYTTDSPLITSQDAFLNINASSNDSKQMLFAVFTMPFSVFSHIISYIFSFIYNSKFVYIYLMFAIQIVLVQITIILIEKLLNLDKIKSIVFIVFMNSTYSVLLYSFLTEQYIFSTFWLVLFIYMYLRYKKTDLFLFVAASGSLITNIIVFPLLVINEKGGKIKKTIYYLLTFICAIAVFGQFTYIPNYLHTFTNIVNLFGGTNILFVDKLKQYLYFIKSMFIAPEGYYYLETYFVRFYRQVIVNHYSISGIIILVLCAISLIKNIKYVEVKIASIWMIYSFLILCVGGYGTAENGLLLYAYYFVWPFVILIFYLFRNINSKVFLIVSVFVVMFLLFENCQELIKIISFGNEYYAMVIDYFI